MKNYINLFEDNRNLVEAIWKRYGLDSYIILKHYSSTIDNEVEIRNKGLRTLMDILRDEKSGLVHFLSENGVKIILGEREGQLFYKNSCYDISSNRPRYLYPKFYHPRHKQNVVECFYYEPKGHNNRADYACPEILGSIDGYLEEYGAATDSPIRTAWMTKKPRLTTYKIACPLRMLSLEGYSCIGDLISDIISSVFESPNRSSDNYVTAIEGRCLCRFLECAPQPPADGTIDLHEGALFWRIPENH